MNRPAALAQLFGRFGVPEHPEQGEVVPDLEAAADDQRQRGKRSGQHEPAMAGLIEDARLRGTAVTLAAAVRSAGVTTAIT